MIVLLLKEMGSQALICVGSGQVGSSMRDELVWTLGFVGVFTMLLFSGFGHQRVRLHGPLKDLLERKSESRYINENSCN
jgi:hypothetical protein